MNILMPQLGETVSEGKITKWLKAVGDKIKPGDNLFEVETDKVTVEVPSMEGGVLQQINVEEGKVALVGAVVAVVGDGTAAAAPKPAPAAAATAPAPAPAASAPAAPAPSPVVSRAPAAPAPAPAARREPTKMTPYHEVMTPAQNYGPAKLANGAAITPLARRLAAEAGLDSARIAGSGPHGRITRRDVEAAIAARPAAAGAPLPAGQGGEAVRALYRNVPFKEIALDNMRRVIARRLIEAKTTIPHFYLSIDLDTDRLMAVREEINKGAKRGADGEPAYKLSVNDFMIKALALALQEVPHANAVWAGDSILEFERSDVAVAVAIPGGLITPVIVSAEAKSLSVISNEMKSLAARARSRSLQPNEYQGGSTAISNLGMYGIREFSAVINPPQATILAIGAAQRAPVETKDGGVAFIGRIAVTLSCDHRVVDGALGAELLNSFKALIENPLRMVV